MSTTTDELTRPRRRPPRSALQRTLDAVVRGVLRSPLHRIVSGRLLLITVTGRRTGARYTYPVAYAEDGGVLLVGTAAAWRRNLRDREPVTVRWRGRDHLARADVVTDEEEAAVLYRTILRKNPVHGRYAGIRTNADGAPNRRDLRRALARGVAVVRLRPNETGGTA
jgi:deazaflavin-dependent oxidoreductase (nitroreductase family)